MKIKILLLCMTIALMSVGCEKEEINSIDQIIGTWTSDLSEVRVEKNGEEAWITYIRVERESTYGLNTSFSCGGCNIVVNNYAFAYDNGNDAADGEFQSPTKLVLKAKVDGTSVRYVLSK